MSTDEQWRENTSDTRQFPHYYLLQFLLFQMVETRAERLERQRAERERGRGRRGRGRGRGRGGAGRGRGAAGPGREATPEQEPQDPPGDEEEEDREEESDDFEDVEEEEEEASEYGEDPAVNPNLIMANALNAVTQLLKDQREDKEKKRGSKRKKRDTIIGLACKQDKRKGKRRRHSSDSQSSVSEEELSEEEEEEEEEETEAGNIRQLKEALKKLKDKGKLEHKKREAETEMERNFSRQLAEVKDPVALEDVKFLQRCYKLAASVQKEVEQRKVKLSSTAHKAAKELFEILQKRITLRVLNERTGSVWQHKEHVLEGEWLNYLDPEEKKRYRKLEAAQLVANRGQGPDRGRGGKRGKFQKEKVAFRQPGGRGRGGPGRGGGGGRGGLGTRPGDCTYPACVTAGNTRHNAQQCYSNPKSAWYKGPAELKDG